MDIELEELPKPGYGFVYILSNPSLHRKFKIGYTTGSISQRIKQLSTTGVPVHFEAERVFQIPECHLRTVETRAHKELKDNKRHRGKEFFGPHLVECVHAVENAIHEIVGDSASDLVGEARKRAEQRRLSEELARKEREQRRRDREERRRIEEERESERGEARRKVEANRAEWVRRELEQWSKKTGINRHPLLYSWGILIAIFGSMLFLIGEMPLGAVAVAGIALWFYWRRSTTKSDFERSLREEAEKVFPMPREDEVRPTVQTAVASSHGTERSSASDGAAQSHGKYSGGWKRLGDLSEEAQQRVLSGMAKPMVSMLRENGVRQSSETAVVSGYGTDKGAVNTANAEAVQPGATMPPSQRNGYRTFASLTESERQEYFNIRGNSRIASEVFPWVYEQSAELLRHRPTGRVFSRHQITFVRRERAGFVIRDSELSFAPEDEIERWK